MPTSLGVVASHRTGSAVFDPLSIAWTFAYWASDPSWTPPANGAEVTSWRNAGSNGSPADTLGIGFPVFSTAYATLNGKPAVTYTGSQGTRSSSETVYNQPFHWYYVGENLTGSTEQNLTDGFSGRAILRLTEGATLLMYAGGVATFGSKVLGTFQIAALFSGASSECRVNGLTYTGLNVGTSGHGAPWVGTGLNGVNGIKGGLVFAGMKAGTLTSTELTNLSTWASSLYGVPAL